MVPPAAQQKGKVAHRLSGVPESYTEKDALLNELLSKMENYKLVKAAIKKEKEEERAASESAGETIRRL